MQVNPDADSATAEDHGGTSGRQRRAQLPIWQESILLLGIALVMAIVIKAFLVQAFYIPSPSMEPGLVKDDRILVQKVSYWGDRAPQRGDVVVFKDPGGWLGPADSLGPTNPIAKVMVKIGLYPSGGHLVKRVMGVEGDVIRCCDKKGRLSVNGVHLTEGSYLKAEADRPCNGPMIGCRWKVGPVPAGHIFVMGDNRWHSADSTVHLCRDAETECSDDGAFIPVDLVVGKVFVVLWPVSNFRLVQRPEHFADISDGS